MNNDNNNNNNNVLPLSLVHDFVTRKYDYIRLCFYHLLTYHAYVKAYIEEYRLFLNRVETQEFIRNILATKRDIVTLPSIAKKAVLNKRDGGGRLYIIGHGATRKYRHIEQTCQRLYEYDRDFEDYVRYLERTIISLSQNLATFKNLYQLHLSVCLERDDVLQTMLMREKFENIVRKNTKI